MKKKTNKAIALVLTIAMLIGCAPVFSIAENIQSGYTYKLIDGGAARITGYSGTETELTIPDELDGYTVTEIGSSAFSDNTSLESVTIPDSVTSIGEKAFYKCVLLENVIIGSGVETIGVSAFNDCSSLAELVIGSGVKTIENSAFYYCVSLESVTIPYGVISIGESAFSGCASIESITIPDSVEAIGTEAFYNTAYYNDDSNWENGILYINNHLIKAKEEDIANSIEIREGTKSIAGEAFYWCSSLTSITIPDGVTSIGNKAFYWCSSLTSVTIPDSVTSIGDYAFYDCTSLESITIPDSVTSIGSGAFYYCKSLISITIPDSVSSIGGRAFHGTAYYNNTSNWENGILYIGNRLIKADESIAGNIEIKDGTKTIADYAFNSCYSVTKITMPDSVTSIGNYAFYDCNHLVSVTIGNGVTSIGDYAFKGCKRLIKIAIPDSVTSIGDEAFYECESLTSVTIPDSVTSIGYKAFYECTSLTSITIPDSVTSIGDYAFYYCKSLTSVTIGDGVKSIGDSAFYYCESLTSITIPDSVTSIGTHSIGYDYSGRYIYYGFKIYGVSGSAAQVYADNNGITFIDPAAQPVTEPTTEPVTEPTTEPVSEPTTEPITKEPVSEEATTRKEPTTWNEPVSEEPTTKREPTSWNEPVSEEPTTKREPTSWNEPVSDETTTKREPTTWNESVSDETTTKREPSSWDEPTSHLVIDEPVSTAVSVNFDSRFSVDNDNKTIWLLTGSEHRSIAAYELKSCFYNDIIVTDSNGNELDDGAVVGSGTMVQVLDNNGRVIAVYTVFVMCDVNGDGYATAADARCALRAAAKLDIIRVGSADANGDGYVKAEDARMIIRYSAMLDEIDNAAPRSDIITTDRQDSSTKLNMTAEKDGDTLTVTVSASGMIGLESADLVFNYNPSYLEYMSCESKTDGSLYAYGNPESGVVTYSLAYTDACYYNSALCEITFKILDPSKTAEISCRLRSWNGTDIPADASVTAEMCSHNNTEFYDYSECGYTPGVYCKDCGRWISGHEISGELSHKDENHDGVCDVCSDKLPPYVMATYAITDDMLTVTVAGINIKGTESFDLEFSYDASVLEYVSVKRGETASYSLPGGGSPKSGVVTFSASWTENCYNDCEDICIITFKILLYENTQIGFTTNSWDGSRRPSDAAFDIELEKPEPEEPVSEELTTEEPTTEEPTTEEPVSEEPTTEEPTSQEPVSVEPTTEEPTTEKITKVEPTTKEPVTSITVKDGGRVSADDENKFVTITADNNKSLTAAELLASLGNENVKIVDKDGNELSSDALVGTGSKVQLLGDSSETLSEYEVIVPSDVNGDGKTTAADARNALRASAKLDNITGVYSIAADMTEDKKITASDARKILRRSAGLER